MELFGRDRVLEDAREPGEEAFGLTGGAEGEQGADGHRSVAQPRVPVVPVADSADALGQGGRGGGEDSAGGFVAQGAQGDRGADDLFAVVAGQGERVDPVRPEIQRAFAHMMLAAGGHISGISRARSAGEDEDDGSAGLLRGDDGRLGSVGVSVLDDVEVDSGGVEFDRFRGAEHRHPVIGPGHAGGNRGVVESGCEADAGRGVAGEHADDDRVVAVSVDGSEVVHTAQPGPPGLEQSRVPEVALGQRCGAVVGGDGEETGRLGAQHLGEHRRRVRQRVRHPADAAGGVDECGRLSVADQAVPLDRGGAAAEEPGFAQLEQRTKDGGDLGR